MSIKNHIRKMKIVNQFRIFLELLHDFRVLAKISGDVSTNSDQEKIEAELMMKTHAIEKGLSMAEVRVGFGEQKIIDILSEFKNYRIRYSNPKFEKRIRNVLSAYFDFNIRNSHKNQSLYSLYNDLFNDIQDCGHAGVINVSRADVNEAINIDFERFLNTRHAIRDFSSEPIDFSLIKKSIEMAKKTPSACNRQPWGVYVYTGQKAKDILKWQGNKGFTDKIQVAIVVTASHKSFFVNEIHQAYVDGGLYAMTLLLCLHSCGLGTIPLTLGMMSSKNQALYQTFDLKESEVPILMIGVGTLKESYNVAISERKDTSEYVHYL